MSPSPCPPWLGRTAGALYCKWYWDVSQRRTLLFVLLWLSPAGCVVNNFEARWQWKVVQVGRGYFIFLLFPLLFFVVAGIKDCSSCSCQVVQDPRLFCCCCWDCCYHSCYGWCKILVVFGIKDCSSCSCYRWCKILDSEENIYEPVIFPGEDTTTRQADKETHRENSVLKNSYNFWKVGSHNGEFSFLDSFPYGFMKVKVYQKNPAELFL